MLDLVENDSGFNGLPETDFLREERFQQPVPPDDIQGDLLAIGGQLHAVVGGVVEQPLLVQALGHVRRRGRRNAEFIGKLLRRHRAMPAQTACNDSALTTANGATVVIADAASGPSWALIRPHSVVLAREQTGTASTRNSWEGTIIGLDRLGDRVRVQVAGGLPLTAEITAAAAEALGLSLGDTIHAAVKATDIEVYPA